MELIALKTLKILEVPVKESNVPQLRFVSCYVDCMICTSRIQLRI